ncbi:MAG: ATP-grasp domain-containing protein, partial [Methanosphaera sp.]|nr:ATP-grasp domain-containing protein [Methanosphaera sp.]
MVVGSNTRAVSKSLKALGYIVYATSFFNLVDQTGYVDKLIIPEYFDSYDLKYIEDAALDYVNEVDYIIFTSDVNTSRFNKSKIIGNIDTKNINNKYKLYKHLSHDFLCPMTYKLDDFSEAIEIVDDNPDKTFITKPIYGSGGIGIEWFNINSPVEGSFLLQEYIKGDNVSSSFLAYTSHDIEMITTSDQIIGSSSLGGSDFTYCGNVTPRVNSSDKITNISSKIARMCRLVGSCGIDFVISNNNAYVIEVNPRIQGTFECIEHSFDMNLSYAHIQACNNNHVNIPSLKKFTVKLLLYSFKNGYYNLSNINGVHDISISDYLFRVGDPITTIISSDNILENAMIRSQQIKNKVYDSFRG